MEIDELKTLLAIEPKWMVALNGLAFVRLDSSDISIEGSTIQIGPYKRFISDLKWLRPDVVRLRTHPRFRVQTDTITLYPGDRVPPPVDHRRRRRAFQTEIGQALCRYFGVRSIQRQMLYSDRQHGIGGAYPRFFIAGHAVVAVDPDESPSVVNGLMRAALLWQSHISRPVVAVVPYGRHLCISSRLRAMTTVRRTIAWLQWDGGGVRPLEDLAGEPETYVKPFAAYQDTAGSPHEIFYAHEERRLESNLIGEIRQILPTIDVRHIYPQVPSFVGEERNVIDLLTITMDGRLVVIEIKASPDPDLPFQALDYWIAVERHRKAGDFERSGYFSGVSLHDAPALLVLVAPLLMYHKTSRQLIDALPADVPLMEIGLNQTWMKEIKVLRRQGMVS